METEEQREARLRRMAEPCGDCAKTKSATGKCRLHRPYVATNADRARWAKADRPEAKAGRTNGAAAARSVNVSRTSGPSTQRTEAAPTRREIS